MLNRPRILVTNDDSIYAPGLRQLCDTLKEFADITVVAPAMEQSGVGLGITVRTPLEIHEHPLDSVFRAWAVTGTPADCVKMATSVILDWHPDLIVSGINRGSNAGRNLLYSGTVGGVIEGVLRGIPGVAFSVCGYENPDFKRTDKYIKKVVRYLLETPLSGGTLLNVNFPYDHHEEIKGLRLARQGKGYWMENPDKRLHPSEKQSYYWLGSRHMSFDEHEDSDIHLLNEGYAAAVPVHVSELTDHKDLSERKALFDSL